MTGSPKKPDVAAELEALRASEATLRLRVQALERAARHQKDLLATVAHELRGPLAAIRNASEVLAHALHTQPALRGLLAILKRQTAQLARLVDDLLDVARIEQGRMLLREEPVEIGQVVDQAVETAQPLIREKRQRLIVTGLAAPAWVRGDHARLVQCIANLLLNAARYTDAGGEVRVTVRGADAGIAIEIRDNGIGIAPGALPRIFDLLSQSGETLERSRGGLGVGLSLVRRLIEMHGGAVEAASGGIGRGSTFTIHLRRFAAVRSASSEGPRAGHRSRRVLVVDHDAEAADAIAALLIAAGDEVEVAYSALSTLEAAERWVPDAILLELDLPRASRYRLVPRLRAHPPQQAAVLIALLAREEDAERASSAGFDRHLAKPPTRATLERVLASADAASSRGESR